MKTRLTATTGFPSRRPDGFTSIGSCGSVLRRSAAASTVGAWQGFPSQTSSRHNRYNRRDSGRFISKNRGRRDPHDTLLTQLITNPFDSCCFDPWGDSPDEGNASGTVASELVVDAAGRNRVMLVEPQRAVRQALERALGSPEIEVAASFATLDEARQTLTDADIRILLVALAAPSDFDESLAIRRDRPDLRLVVLDHGINDRNVQQTLRWNLAGYLTKEQSLTALRHSLQRIGRGERVFVPEIAARLVFTTDGIRLASNARTGPLDQLTPRELDVLIHIARGLTVKECAQALTISPSTVDNHKARLMAKLKIHKSVELTHLAMREGLLAAGAIGPSPATSRLIQAGVR